MNNHMIFEVIQHLNTQNTELLLSLNRENNSYKDTYLYEYPTVDVNYCEIEKYIGKKVKINVFDVRNKQELKKLMDMQLKILIVLKQVIYSMVIFVIYRMVWNI